MAAATTSFSLSFTATTSTVPVPIATGIPLDCATSYQGSFPIEILNTTSPSLQKRQGTLVISITDSVLKDSANRTGFIAATSQFEFDYTVPSDALYGAGWSVCPGGKVFLGSDSVFQQCLSGRFYNLYYQRDDASCYDINIYAVTPGGTANTTAAASSSTTFTTTTMTSTGTATPSSTPPPEKTSGLSTGAQAGIGVGVALGVILLAAIAFFLLRRRRRARRTELGNFEKAELPADTKPERKSELAAADLYEADGTERPPEMDNAVRAELESDWRGWEMHGHSDTSKAAP